MRTLALILCLISLGFPDPVGLGAQVLAQTATAKRGLSRATARSDLAVDLGSSTKLRLASRKTKYHVGEMISVDFAIMNDSKGSLFLLDPRSAILTFNAFDAGGKRVDIWDYAAVLHGLVTDSYSRVEPGDFVAAHFHILAGRDDAAFRMAPERGSPDQSREPRHLRAFFENDLFVEWGDAYLDTKLPGTYTITAEYSNEFVVVDPDNPKVQTATGTVVSSPLKIILVE